MLSLLYKLLNKYRHVILLALWAVAILLSLWGMASYRPCEGIWDILYRTIVLVAFSFSYLTTDSGIKELPWQLEVGRFGVAFLVLGSAMFALAQIFGQKLRLKMLGITSNHVLICGLGRKGVNIARQYLKAKDKKKIVIIETNPTVDELESLRADGAIIVIGNAADGAILKACYAERAANIYAFCGGGADNWDIANHVVDLRKSCDSHSDTTKCIVHLPDETLHQALSDWQSQDIRFFNYQDIRFFNYIEAGARRLFHLHPPHRYNKQLLDKKDKDVKAPHVVIIGFGQLGRKITEQIIHLCHYPSLKKPKLTVIDNRAEEREKEFREAYPQLNSACDIVFNSQDARKDMPTLTADIDVVYISLGDDLLTIATALRMSPNELKKPDTPELPGIIACVSRNNELLKRSRNIKLFVLPSEACSLSIVNDESLDAIAMSIYAHYLVSTKHGDGAKLKEHENNPSEYENLLKELWYRLPDDERKANRWPADHFKIKSEIMKISEKDENPASTMEMALKDEATCETLAAIEHHRWMAFKFMTGWHIEHHRWMASKFMTGWHNDSSKKSNLKYHKGLKPWNSLDPSVGSEEKCLRKTKDEINNLPEIERLLNKEQKTANWRTAYENGQ